MCASNSHHKRICIILRDRCIPKRGIRQRETAQPPRWHGPAKGMSTWLTVVVPASQRPRNKDRFAARRAAAPKLQIANTMHASGERFGPMGAPSPGIGRA